MKKLIFGVAGLAFLSCNKYEDGSGLQMKSAKSRISNTWEIDKVMRNSNDVSEDYHEYVLQLYTNGEANLIGLYTFGDYTFEDETAGVWKFSNRKTKIELDFENDEADQSYQIESLTSTELKLREIGGEEELYFKIYQ